MSNTTTKDQILVITREILASQGLGAVSFDAIARRLGLSKQAVLYWYPTKHDLMAALFLPWLEMEAEVAVGSIADAADRDEAIRAYVKAIAGFHLEDLDRFRMMYLLPQTIKPSSSDLHDVELLQRIHPVTDQIYGALAPFLEGDDLAARRQAFTIHSSVLGLVLMFGLSDSLDDPLKHSSSDLVDALIASLASS